MARQPDATTPNAATEATRRWRAANPERAKEWSRQYRERNAEDLKRKQAEWRASHWEHRADYQREWDAQHPGYDREWRAAHPSISEGYKRTRRERFKAAFVKRVRKAVIYQRDQGLCQICGSAVPPDDVHLDHIVPLCRGGTHEPDNVQLVHWRCNRAKGRYLMEEFRELHPNFQPPPA